MLEKNYAIVPEQLALTAYLIELLALICRLFTQQMAVQIK